MNLNIKIRLAEIIDIALIVGYNNMKHLLFNNVYLLFVKIAISRQFNV